MKNLKTILKENKNLILLICILLIVTIFALYAGFTNAEGKRVINSIINIGNMNTCIQSLDKFQNGNYIGELRDGLPSCVLANIPAKPARYDAMQSMIKIGKISAEDFCTQLDSAYWLQPDFYPNNGPFYELYKNPIRDADGTLRRGVAGYGSFISELTASVTPGDNFSSCVFVHSSWYVWVWQSMAFEAKMPNEATFKQNRFADGTTTVINANDSAKYFKINMDPPYILLEPSYPSVFKGWASKVRVDVEVLPNTPKGKYMIVISPSSKIPLSVEQQWEKEYMTNYVGSVGAYIDILMIGVEVN